MRSKREKYQRAYIQLTGKGQALYVLSRSSDCTKLLTTYHVLSLSACVTPAFSLLCWKVVWKGKWHFCVLPVLHLDGWSWSYPLQGCSGGWGAEPPFFFILRTSDWKICQPWPMYWISWIFNDAIFPAALLHGSQSWRLSLQQSEVLGQKLRLLTLSVYLECIAMK